MLLFSLGVEGAPVSAAGDGRPEAEVLGANPSAVVISRLSDWMTSCLAEDALVFADIPRERPGL